VTIPYAEVIGDPIAHSKSPEIHRFWLATLGMDGDYGATRVTSETLGSYLRARRADPDWRGCNVTMPLKQIAANKLDRLTDEALKIGAVNTIVREGGTLVGHNTDAQGFMEPIDQLVGREALVQTNAVVVGAGGAALAVATMLWQAGCRLRIANRNRDRAREVADRVAGVPSSAIDTPSLFQLRELLLGPVTCHPPLLSVLVNATSLGMRGKPALDVRLDTAPAGLIVYDLVYDPVVTPLLSQARERGLRTIDGLQMLVAQARRAFQLFFGEAPGNSHDSELRELLTR
jgi:shikimate dehydrogenase